MSPLDVTIAALVGGTTGYLAAYLRSQALATASRIYRHDHVWGMWEDCDISDREWVAGQRRPVLRAGQKRDCMGCGQREVRTVETKP